MQNPIRFALSLVFTTAAFLLLYIAPKDFGIMGALILFGTVSFLRNDNNLKRDVTKKDITWLAIAFFLIFIPGILLTNVFHIPESYFASLTIPTWLLFSTWLLAIIRLIFLFRKKRRM